MKRIITIVTIGIGVCLSAFAAQGEDGGQAQSKRMVCDETCKLESAVPAVAPSSVNAATPAVKEAGYSVVSPVGRSSVKIINQAPRLKSLSGKTIAVVGTNFMAKVTHPEIKRLILENYPDAKVILRDEIGVAGLYPAPGMVRRAKDEFQRKLKSMKVDAVISGNGGCGLCTPKETGSCIAAEYAAMTPTAPWRDSADAEQLTVPVMKPGMTHFLITGDAARNKMQTMPGEGNATILIELPSNWDKLMADPGYEPLHNFKL